jgi:tight adherence protein C
MPVTEAVALLWALAAASLAWASIELRRAQEVRQRMERLSILPGGAVATAPGLALRPTIGSLGARLTGRWPALGVRARVLKDAAGLTAIGVEELVGWKALAALAGVAISFLIFEGSQIFGILLLLVLPPLGWLGIDVWLQRKAAARQRAILHSLLTVMDLLALSLEAGMGLDRALRLICDRVESPLTEELRRVLAEVDLGISRREAFSHLAERLPVEDIRSLTTAIVQAEELSVSLVEAMRTQARSLRLKRRQEAEAEAHRIPVKMMFPMVLFVLPSLFIVIIGPVVLQLMQALSR